MPKDPEPLEKPNPRSISEIKTLISTLNLEPGNESYNRKLLEDGFENIKNRIKFNEALKEANNISIDVEHVGGWINNFVRDTLGGSIDVKNQIIYWDIQGTKIVFDPFGGNIDYAKS
jgi:hypothetical protein